MEKLNAFKIAMLSVMLLACCLTVGLTLAAAINDAGQTDLFRKTAVAPLGSDAGSRISPQADAPPETETTLTLSFVGDCLLSTMLGGTEAGSFNAAAEIKEPDYFFGGVADIFKNDNLTVANCESVFTDSALTASAKVYSPAYWYRGKSKNAGIFTAGGIEVVSLANNHSGDYGAQGLADTVAAVEAAGLEWGDDGKPLTFELEGVRIGIYLCTLYSPWNASRIKAWLAETAETADYRIVYYHGGTERVYSPDGWRVTASRELADAGADLVIGGHPHVLQPLEFYGGATICYSLGNFLFGGSRTTDRYTAILQVKLTVSEGKILASEPVIIPCYEYTAPGDWRPVPVEESDPAYGKIMDFMYGRSDTLK